MTIVDFEEASYYYRVFDIGMTIIGVCSGEEKLILKKAIHLLRGYSKEIQLIPRERDSLKAFIVYAAAAMSFWRHRNFNQTNPTSERADHYLALKNLADHVMGISDERFSSLF
jgi:homoserine kinase type II